MNDSINLPPLVSICCLTYNHENYIRECLEGFISQKTNFLFEILIHDDASTDKTADIIREYESKYPDIVKPIYQKENQFSKGIKVSYEYNFKRSMGKYLAFCEGDDFWIESDKLQKQVDFLESHLEYGMVYSAFHLVDNNGLKIEQEKFNDYMKHSFSGDLFPFLLQRNIILTVSTCFRREYFKECDTSFKFDYWLYLDIARCSLCHYIESKDVAYRINPNGISLSNRAFFHIEQIKR